jgi:branched-chain amino acid transport system ATP-binding protein
LLSLSNLNVSIASVHILRGVSLELAAGSMTGLIGRNGAGKTTLIKTVMGLLKPGTGSVRFEGRDLAGVRTYARARLGIGYMPEDRRLIPDLTVEENILLPAWAGGAGDEAARFATILGYIPEIRELGPRKGSQLSGGQQKLAALARALMSGTRLLLLDEPFEGVAPALSQRLSEVIAGLKGTDLAVLITQSELNHSRMLFDHEYVIERGVSGKVRSAA